MTTYKTEQEEFWAGEFGQDYSQRNTGDLFIAGNIQIFSKVIMRTSGIKSMIEFGANVGANLEAIRKLLPDIELSAIEINKTAIEYLRKRGDIRHIYEGSIIDFKPDYQRDLVLIKTVLIHIQPDLLPLVYDLLYQSSKKYICVAEYYSPAPVSVTYRGHENRLFKRDFAGEMIKRLKLRLVDYGFAYRNDPNYGSEYDDINWFLLEKS
jgi:pseudaminic acid biosynthesis-associated methylase